jgi:hypothetical protein
VAIVVNEPNAGRDYWLRDGQDYGSREHPSIFLSIEQFRAMRTNIPARCHLEVLPVVTASPIERIIKPDELASIPANRRLILLNEAGERLGRNQTSVGNRPWLAIAYSAGELIGSDSLDKYQIALLERAKCDIAQHFSSSALALIKAMPNLPEMRGFMLSQLGVMPPPEADTYDKVKAWVESNVAAKPIPMSKGRSDDPTVPIIIDVSEIEYGTCHFRTPRTGRCRVELSLIEIREIVDEQGLDDLDALLNAIVSDQAETNDDLYSDMESGSTNYDDHEASGSDSREADIADRSRTRATLAAFLQSHAPDLATQLQVT